MTDSGETFGTLLNCMDGRVQMSAFHYCQKRFGVDHVDTITEAGIVRFVSDDIEGSATEATLGSIRISVEKHASTHIAVAAHPGCAGNPIADADQRDQLRKGVSFLQGHFLDCEVIGLFVGLDGSVEEIA
jgi:hypothetical protein